jgi:GxxExxY protein
MTSIPHQNVTGRIIVASMHVYNTLGSGFNEAVYDKAMSVALEMQGLAFESQKPVEVFFEGVAVGLYYLDFLVEQCVVLELKALPELTSSHLAQTITYLTSTGSSVGLLVNFGTSKLEWRRVLPPKRIQVSKLFLARQQQ